MNNLMYLIQIVQVSGGYEINGYIKRGEFTLAGTRVYSAYSLQDAIGHAEQIIRELKQKNGERSSASNYGDWY